ncbi:125 kDa kinesin-like protein, partial [Trifolium medium]|nr:125 kDa kinesin-like protein [Trifolium medium]
VNTAHSAFGQVKRTQDAVNELGTKHIFATESLIRSARDSNVQHVAEVNSARAAAEEDV